MFRRAGLFAGALLLGAGVHAESILITGARVADGSGGPLRTEAVRVVGDRIAAVGANLRPKKGERVVRGDGLVLAPGFIDIHNHSESGLVTDPLAASQVSQGITTLAIGPDGESPWPLDAYLKERRQSPPAVNVLAFVGHATVREKVMGSDYKRAATPEEVSRMAQLVEEAMRQGAVGLSSGLEYEVGGYGTTDELVAMSSAAARYGGIYMTHIRDEADKSFDAFREALEIGRRARIPVQISHIKLGTVGVWGRVAEAVKLFASARAAGQDVTADCYPYEAWHANIEVLVPNKKYADPPSVERALADVGGPARVTITACKAHPDYVGKNLEEIGRALNTSPVEAFIRIVRDGGADVIGHSMKAEDVAAFLAQPWVMIGSDGGIGSEHPRGAGTFPRVLARYVRDQHLFSLPEAIRKMTSFPAQRLSLRDRGRIAAGFKADLVLFDPDGVIDRSTFEQPERLSEGIRHVWVNGEEVWNGESTTGARPGRVLLGRGSVTRGLESSNRRAARLESTEHGLPADASSVDAIFHDYDRGDSPGCAMAVVRDGRVRVARGFGMASLENDVHITPDTTFDIGSAAKQFTAACVVLLAQEGKLTLDDDVRRYVPQLPDYGHRVTLLHLLHHTSGLRDYTNLLSLAGARVADVTTDREALDLLARQKGVDFEPGAAYRYCNSGYFLLSLVVRRASGKTLRDFARERIFEPLGMTNTRFVNDHREVVPRRATGYAKASPGYAVAASDWEQNGDGGLQTTARDLARWSRNFERPIVGGAALVDELTRTGSLSSGQPIDYALGLRVDRDGGLLRVRHGGSWAGFKAEFLRYPERHVAVVVLCNRRDAVPSRLAREVARGELPELPDRLGAPASEAAAPGNAPFDSGPYAGVYWNADRLEARRLWVENGLPWYSSEAGEKRPLRPIAAGRFRVAGTSLEVSIERTGNGADERMALTERGEDEPPGVWTRVAENPPRLTEAELSRMRGAFYSDELDATFRIRLVDGRLVLDRRGSEPAPLEPLFAKAFETRDLGAVVFEEDGAGGIRGFEIAVGPSRLSFSRTGA